MTITQIADISWRESYGCYSAKVGIINLSFSFKSGAFIVCVGGATLKGRPTSVEDAAILAKRGAILHLENTLDLLKRPISQGTEVEVK